MFASPIRWCGWRREEEVLEYAGAFMQLYREEAHYLERTAPWIARVGIDYVKTRLVEDGEGRAALHARFLRSQLFAQVDPWTERAMRRRRPRIRPPARDRDGVTMTNNWKKSGTAFEHSRARRAAALPKHEAGIRSRSSAPARMKSSR